MKSLPTLIALCLSVLLVSAPAAEPSKETQPQQEQQLLAAIKEVQGQQVAIADNQVKIDAKLVSIAEALRMARIYSSRSGK
ncbi:MAG: hypothetical protein DLM73_15115 [Chthoniobacterales bacterium]|nr:MAG: hypothetical protein DLM73_15115 [Chthoniobacterales bacterium]